MESECSVLESVEDNEVIGSSVNLDNTGDTISMVEKNTGAAVEVTEPVNLLHEEVVVGKGLDLGLVSGSSSPDSTMIKGRGLRKWRRIKREVTKDGVVSVDSSKLLKRGLSNPRKTTQFSGEMKQKSEGSVSSTNAIMTSPGVPVFASRTESENSEVRSSKSSKSVSGPKIRYDGSVGMEQLSDKNRMTSLGGVQQGNVVPGETSKKARGDRFKIEKENSLSSMESDSRSSNFVFVQGTNSMPGIRNGRSMNYSDEGQVGDGKRSDGDLEDVSHGDGDFAAGSSWGGNEENSENQRCSTNEDPWAESILLLQSAQEALEKEVQEFREVGTGDILVDDLSQNSRLEQLRSSDVNDLESEINSLKENINGLESKLDETTTMLKVKESKVVELETIASNRLLEDPGNYREIESELEALFRLKIEAEIEYTTISRTIETLRDSSFDQISILEEQKKLALEQSKMLNKVENAESKAVTLKRKSEKLEDYYDNIVSAAETLKLQTTVCKYTLSFVTQFILLAVFLCLFVLQSSPQSAGVAPT